MLLSHASLAAALAWRPSAPISWRGSQRFGPVFDPLAEFGGYVPPEQRPERRPLLIYLPGLDGNSFTAFAQFAGLGAAYDLRVLFPDRQNAESGGDHDGLVAALAEEVEAQAASGREMWLMGESFGGVQALAVAQALKERSSSRCLSGIVCVNPATSFGALLPTATRPNVPAE